MMKENLNQKYKFERLETEIQLKERDFFRWDNYHLKSYIFDKIKQLNEKNNVKKKELH